MSGVALELPVHYTVGIPTSMFLTQTYSRKFFAPNDARRADPRILHPKFAQLNVWAAQPTVSFFVARSVFENVQNCFLRLLVRLADA